MKHLLELIENEFCESDGWFRIISADWMADELRLEVSICLCESERETQVWEISCSCVFSEFIVSEYSETLSLEDNDPLLLQYKDLEVDLAFSKNLLNPYELYGVVATTCIKHLGELPISNWLNSDQMSSPICSSKYGILGRFPMVVAKEICVLLENKDISIKPLEPHDPKYWDGEQFNEYPSNMEVLIIGNSYVVGTGFSAERT